MANDERLESAAQALHALVAQGRAYIRDFNSASYEAGFRTLLDGCTPMLARVHAELESSASDEQTALRAISAQALELLGTDWAGVKKLRRPQAQLEDKIALATLLIPAVRHLHDSVSEALSEALRDEWLLRCPKDPFQLGTYEEISGGFRSKFRLCFITTAVCRSEGKPDDCYELTAFRRYRDEWLARQPGGREQIAEYYRVAPAIVTLIDCAEDAPRFYRGLRRRYLEPCLARIERGEMEACRAVYTEMVETLCARYRLSRGDQTTRS